MELVKVITRGRADVLIGERSKGQTAAREERKGREGGAATVAKEERAGGELDVLQPTRRRKVITMGSV